MHYVYRCCCSFSHAYSFFSCGAFFSPVLRSLKSPNSSFRCESCFYLRITVIQIVIDNFLFVFLCVFFFLITFNIVNPLYIHKLFSENSFSFFACQYLPSLYKVMQNIVIAVSRNLLILFLMLPHFFKSSTHEFSIMNFVKNACLMN